MQMFSDARCPAPQHLAPLLAALEIHLRRLSVVFARFPVQGCLLQAGKMCACVRERLIITARAQLGNGAQINAARNVTRLHLQHQIKISLRQVLVQGGK